MKKCKQENNRETLQENIKKQNENPKTKSKLKTLLVIFGIGILTTILVILAKPYLQDLLYKILSIDNLTTVSGERLVFRSKLDEQKIIQYDFKEGIVYKIKIQEKFNSESEFEQAKQMYSNENKYKIIFLDNNNLTIQVKKIDFGVDENLSYEGIYEKYIVQIIGAYELI